MSSSGILRELPRWAMKASKQAQSTISSGQFFGMAASMTRNNDGRLQASQASDIDHIISQASGIIHIIDVPSDSLHLAV